MSPEIQTCVKPFRVCGPGCSAALQSTHMHPGRLIPVYLSTASHATLTNRRCRHSLHHSRYVIARGDEDHTGCRPAIGSSPSCTVNSVPSFQEQTHSMESLHHASCNSHSISPRKSIICVTLLMICLWQLPSCDVGLHRSRSYGSCRLHTWILTIGWGWQPLAVHQQQPLC